MARQIAWIFAGALLCVPAAAWAAPASRQTVPSLQHEHDQQKDARQNEQRRPRFIKWWVEPQSRAELGITDQQSAAIEKIWQANMPVMRQRYREHEQLEPALEKLLREGTADPEIVAREIDRVENLTAEIRKARIGMIYRMQHELTADQRVKLRAMDDRRRESDSRKSPGPDHRH